MREVEGARLNMPNDSPQDFDPDTLDLKVPLHRLGPDAMARLEAVLKQRRQVSFARLKAGRRGLDPAYLTEYESQRRRRARLKEWYDYNVALRKFGQEDAARQEVEDASAQKAIESHNRAVRRMLKEAGVSEAEIGTYKATQRLAERSAAKDGAKFRQNQKPELAELCGHILAAFDDALQIAFWTRASAPPNVADFVRCVCRLEAHVARYEAISDLQGRWQQWPIKPATVFLWKTANSALGAAAQFAVSIRGGAVTAARAMTPPHYSGWRGKIEGLRVTPDPDLYFAAWRDMALKELLTRTMPAPPNFPIWEIRRDAQALQMKIGEEWKATQSLSVPVVPRPRAKRGAFAPGEAGLLNGLREWLVDLAVGINCRRDWQQYYSHGKHVDERNAQANIRKSLESFVHPRGGEVSKEADAGLGPADFLISRPPDRIVLELKPDDGKVRQGIKTQLPTLVSGREPTVGLLLVLDFAGKFQEKTGGQKRLKEWHTDVRSKHRFRIDVAIVKCPQTPPSASKRKRPPGKEEGLQYWSGAQTAES